MKDSAKPKPMPKPATPDTSGQAASDRRCGKDRRKVDLPSPVGRERRRHVEPRLPDVAEIELTPSQWDELNT